MSHQFKPGDLALIVKAFREQNIGKTVELVRFSSDRWIPYGVEGHMADNWRLARCWVINGEIETDQEFEGENITLLQAVAMEQHLMPLRDDFAPTGQKSTAVPA